MRRRLKNFLPIVLIALVVQIFAPIGACWAASIAASDPLAAAVICHGNANGTTGQSDQTGHRAHDGCCSVCSVLHTGAPVDVPQTADAIVFERQARARGLGRHSRPTDSAPAPALTRKRARLRPFPDLSNIRTIGAASAALIAAVQ